MSRSKYEDPADPVTEPLLDYLSEMLDREAKQILLRPSFREVDRLLLMAARNDPDAMVLDALAAAIAFDTRFLVRALQRGADGVLVAGCHPGDCHYSTGNYFARRRFLLARRFIEYLGLEPERLWVKWISGSEGNKFADVVREMSAAVAKLGPNRKVREAR